MVFGAYVGHAAGVLTSIFWTATSLLFTAAARRIGPTFVNGLRIGLAVVLLGLTHRLLQGQWIPNVVSRQVLLLMLSGIIGLTIGDQALFISFMDIGPRLAVLIMTTSPLIATILGWAVLGETLNGMAVLGIVVTLGGVAWVVAERPGGDTTCHSPHRLRGILLAVVGAAGQAGGLILSKQGMGYGWLPEDAHLDPQAATFIRMVGASVGMIPLLLYSRMTEKKSSRAFALRRKRRVRRAGMVFAGMGTIFGPYLGVWMSLVAVSHAKVGVAQTLCSLTPVFLLPCVAIIHKERISLRAVVGAIVAVSGIALLFIQKSGAH